MQRAQMIRDLFPNVKKESQNKSPFRAEKYFKAARMDLQVRGSPALPGLRGRDNSAYDHYYY